MRKTWIASMIVAGLAFPALGQDAPKKVQRAADQLFPDGKAQISPGREVNGVKTYNATARSDGGESRAVLTENGDVLVSSEQRTKDTPPAPVRRVVEGLFGMETEEFGAVSNTYYIVDSSLDGKPYHLRFDAAGRVRDVETRAEAERRDTSSLSKATDDSSQRAEQYINRWHEGAKIQGVYKHPDIDGFYVVEYTDEDGNKTQTILNDQGRVYFELTELDRDELPQPVQRTMDRMFKGAKVNNVVRTDTRYYQFEDEIEGTSTTVRIRPNGEVLAVYTDTAEEEERAVTAGARSKARDSRQERDERMDRKSDKADQADRNRND